MVGDDMYVMIQAYGWWWYVCDDLGIWSLGTLVIGDDMYVMI